jgi:hypothetical protein
MAATIEQLESELALVTHQLKEGHYCIQQEDIGKTLGILTNIVKEFYGNGTEGLSKTIPKLQVQVSTLITTSAANCTAISALAKAVTEITAINGYKQQENLTTRQRATIAVTGIIGGSGVIIALLNLILK